MGSAAGASAAAHAPPEPPERPSPLEQPLLLRSGYEAVLGREPEFTNYAADFAGTIDYIFVEAGSELMPRRALLLPGREAVAEFGALPSPIFPSDHLPLLVAFGVERA